VTDVQFLEVFNKIYRDARQSDMIAHRTMCTDKRLMT